jgi:hypothetical protein
MQYIEHIDANGVVAHVPVNNCTFTVAETPVTITGGNSGSRVSATRKVTHFSLGTPTLTPTELAGGIKARLGYFTNSGHFNYITDES